MTVRFGPGGIPHQSGGSSTQEGVRCCAELGLGTMEMEFVRGVRMGQKQAGEVRALAGKLDVALSSHAPYFINLCSAEPEKEEASRRHIREAAQATVWAGGTITVFHPGYYQKLTPAEAYGKAKKGLQKAEEELEGLGIRVRLGAEVVGKKSQFGGLDEVVRLSQELEMVVPVLDFCHLHARGDWKLGTKGDYERLFQRLEKALPGYMKDFHSHFAEVNYSEKGELNHLPLGTKNEPPFEPLMEVLAEQGYGGRIVCESPKLEYDALKMQALYRRFGKR